MIPTDYNKTKAAQKIEIDGNVRENVSIAGSYQEKSLN